MMEVLFVTGNRGKVDEASAILEPLGIRLAQKELDIAEIQDTDVSVVSEKKAMDAFSILKKPLIVEDTGLHVKGLNGYPGALIKHFVESIGRQGIVDCVKGKDPSAEAICVITYCGPDGKVKSFHGSVRGKISGEVSKGGYEFGWDPIFIPECHTRTFAEMGVDEKNKISHRMKAFSKFAAWLKKNPQ